MELPSSIAVEADLGKQDARRRDSAEHLFELHFDAIYNFFYRRLRSSEDAQDLTAETFLAIVEKRAPRNVDPLCWLYGIARRKLADALRKRRKTLVDLPQPTPLDPRAEELRQLIDGLPEAQREALLLQTLEDLSLEQIAHVMGKSRGSVKALLQRAKETVRRQSNGSYGAEVEA